jgi:hypothetical protein
MAMNALLCHLEDLRAQHDRVDAKVTGAKLLDDVLDVVRPALAYPEPSYNLTEAAALTGYTADHLGRLVRRGSIPNRGLPGRPRVRLSDCPSRKYVEEHRCDSHPRPPRDT